MIEILGKGKKKELWVDGKFFCVINDFLILKYKLSSTVPNSEKLEEIKNEAEVELGFNMAVDYVSSTSKSSKQVLDYLIKKISPKNANVVLEKLKGYRYVDDFEFAKNFVESKSATCGKNKLKLMLMQKGVDKAVIDDALANVESVYTAMKVAEKYMRSKEVNKQNLEKLTRHLLSKGFTWDEISAARSRFKERIDESWD